MKTFIIFFILCFYINSSADDKNTFFDPDTLHIDTTNKIDLNIPNELFYLDLIGNIYGVTLCYEKKIYKIDNYQRLYFRSGLGASWALIAPDGLGVPLTVNYILGKNYCLEIGLGVLLYGKLYDSQASNFNSDIIKFIGNISYRYHFQNNSHNIKLFKIGFSPIYEVNNSVLPNTHFSPSISICIGL